MSAPRYYNIAAKPTPEEFGDQNLIAIMDELLGKMVQLAVGSTSLNFTLKVGVGATVTAALTITKDDDAWYVNGTKFAFATYGGILAADAIAAVAQGAAIAVLGLTAAEATIIIGGVVAGPLIAAGGAYVWSTFVQPSIDHYLIDYIFGTQDVEIQHMVDGVATAGVAYDNLDPADLPSALAGIAEFAHANANDTLDFYSDKELTKTYVVLGNDAGLALASAMGVTEEQFATWEGAKDGDGDDATNGEVIISDDQTSWSFADKESVIALKILSGDGSHIEDLTVSFDQLGLGSKPPSLSGELTVIVGVSEEHTELLDGGSASKAIIIGGGGNDIIHGTAGDDRLFADVANKDSVGITYNELYGESGNDLLVGGAGGDLIVGGGDSDLVFGAGGSDKIDGGTGDDTIFGDDEVEVSTGQAEDIILGGTGRDFLVGGSGDDTIIGGNGNFSNIDLSTAHSEWNDGERDVLSGGSGSDTFYVYADRWFEGPPSVPDQIDVAKSQIDIIDILDTDFTANLQIVHEGRLANFELSSAMISAAIQAGTPDLGTVTFGDGPDALHATIRMGSSPAGMTVIYAAAENTFSAMIVGISFGLSTTDPDASDIAGSNGDDDIIAGDGQNNISGRDGDDYLDGGGGDDTVSGGAGSDGVVGGDGNDHLSGGDGDDWFDGGSGNDTIDGGDGIDEVDYYGTLEDFVFVLNLDTSVSVESEFGTDTLTNIENIWLYADDGSYQEFALEDLTVPVAPQVDITGTSGNDVLVGSWRGETIQGGAGDDQLRGQAGSDIYIYRAGEGNDVINDGKPNSYNTDILRLTDLNQSDVSFERIGKDLRVNILTTGSFITITNQFLSHSEHWGVEKIEFADASSWGLAEIERLSWTIGTSGDDQLQGRDNYEDVFIGGEGDDVLSDFVGNDTYVYASGDGNDLIDDQGGWSLSDVDVLRFTDLNSIDLSFRRDGFNLVIEDLTTQQIITIDEQYYDSRSHSGVEKIEFADGTSWSLEQIEVFGRITGTSQDDVLQGTYMADIFDGGAGNDTINAGDGNDTIYYARGDGNDTITESGEWDSDDRLVLSNINPADVTLVRNGNDVTLVIAESAAGAGDGGSILLKGNLNEDYYSGIDKIVFADGTTWDRAYQRSHISYVGGTSGNDTITGTSGADSIHTGPGDDTLIGLDGDDTFVFRSDFGHDTINDFAAGAQSVDIIDVGTDIFADFASVLAAASQVGADTVITHDANTSITLKNVALTSLHQDDFRFTAAA
jgi:Ca2+-binding RTX toxin-like protein